ncbi:MAG: DnaD domain protein [Clostridia bacterium]|nr:DnaD domain protein [Clostridia bacterium]
MSIHVAPELLGRVFFVPKAIVDEHLPYVTGQQLKALLYVLRHAGEELEVEDLAVGLRMSVPDVTDALQYWFTTGVLTQGEAADAAKPAGTPPTANTAPKPYVRKGNSGASPEKAKKELPVIQDITPSYETVAARLQEDAGLKAMFQEVQARMGRTIGYADQAKFIMMHDDYGLPPEVILTIIEYSVKKGKGTAYMCRVGKNWAEEGVCTLEDAMEKLEKIAKTDKAWTEFTSLFSTDPPKPTDSRLNFLRKWRFTYGQSAELIYHAYETMVEAIDKVNFNYMDKILTRWNEEGLRTPQDVLQAEKGDAPASGKRGTKANRRGKKLAGDNHKASYDSDAYRDKAQGPIEYKPKGDK